MILIIDCGSSKVPKFKEILDGFDIGSKIVLLNDLVYENKFSGVIISGSHFLLTEFDTNPFLNKFDFIKGLDIPVLGVCFGHQVLGLLYNASIWKGEDVRYEQEVSFVVDSPLFDNIPDNSVFLEDHCEYISLPKDFNLLAKSKNCKNEAMKHRNKPFYGIQFHPEVSGDAGRTLLRNFCHLCGL